MTDREPTYLNFEEQIPPNSSDSSIDVEVESEEEIAFSEEDFAKLARQADGSVPDSTHNNDPLLSQEMAENSSESEKMEEDEEIAVLNKQTKKINSPYLKIAVAIILTSSVAICMFILRNSWMKIVNASQQETTKPEYRTSAVEKQKVEIDDLKAELALIEQSKKPIPPPRSSEPQPEPQSEPQPEPQSEPQPRAQPKPQPEPQPEPTEIEINPEKRWNLLAELGSTGSSNLGSHSPTRDSVGNSETDGETITASGSNRERRSYPANGTESKPVMARDSVRDVFSAEAKQLVLNGLGVERNISASQNISTGSIIRGTLESPIVWTDESLPYDTRASVVLEEAIKYSNGDIAIPNGSSIIVEVANWNDAGFVTLNAIALVYEDSNERLNQIELEPDSVVIKGKANQPLAMRTERNNNETMNFLGDLIKEGSRSFPVPRGVGDSVSQTLNGGRSRRSQVRNIYSIEAGTEVSIAIDPTIELNPQNYEDSMVNPY